jgi:hypothetical protein
MGTQETVCSFTRKQAQGVMQFLEGPRCYSNICSTLGVKKKNTSMESWPTVPAPKGVRQHQPLALLLCQQLRPRLSPI